MDDDYNKALINFLDSADDIAAYLNHQIKNKFIEDILSMRRIEKYSNALDDFKNHINHNK